MFRRFLIAFALIVIPVSAFAAYPQPTGFVNDLANVIDSDTRPKLETMLRGFEKTSGDGISSGTMAIVKTISGKKGISFDANAALGGNANQSAPAKKGKSKTVLTVLFWIIMVYLFIRHPWLFLFFMSGGGGRGGGFGGGFGGFGGGLSGGGGASRSW